MTDERCNVRLEIEWDGSVGNPFGLLLGQGARIKTQVGCSISDLLCTHIGIEREYLENRIQTIFLNGEVIDDLETTIVMDQDVLALSAAMPGVAGATLRRGGRYAAMRSNISYGQSHGECDSRQGTVVIKLFNLVARELSAFFLAHGISVDGKDWLDLLQRVPAAMWQNCRRAAVDGRPADVQQLDNPRWREGAIDLVVRVI